MSRKTGCARRSSQGSVAIIGISKSILQNPVQRAPYIDRFVCKAIFVDRVRKPFDKTYLS